MCVRANHFVFGILQARPPASVVLLLKRGKTNSTLQDHKDEDVVRVRPVEERERGKKKRGFDLINSLEPTSSESHQRTAADKGSLVEPSFHQAVEDYRFFFLLFLFGGGEESVYKVVEGTENTFFFVVACFFFIPPLFLSWRTGKNTASD